ncbi:conserved hypothetical protein [Ricinus communis]|uniref:Uncharacterized protein n=1 Tax=Ricinus communis TaxID=3988 RepID=B9SWL4_RICCO|nr:conserved hypothetical protein [Ricinus communis]
MYLSVFRSILWVVVFVQKENNIGAYVGSLGLNYLRNFSWIICEQNVMDSSPGTTDYGLSADMRREGYVALSVMLLAHAILLGRKQIWVMMSRVMKNGKRRIPVKVSQIVIRMMKKKVEEGCLKDNEDEK